MKKELGKIAQEYGLLLVILFGSAAKKTMHSKSDVDIAVIVKKDLNLKKELQLKHKLKSLFQKEVDLVIVKNGSPLLLGAIARHGKLLYGNKKDFTSFRVQAMKSYIDFKPYFELRIKTIRKTLNSYA